MRLGTSGWAYDTVHAACEACGVPVRVEWLGDRPVVRITHGLGEAMREFGLEVWNAASVRMMHAPPESVEAWLRDVHAYEADRVGQ